MLKTGLVLNAGRLQQLQSGDVLASPQCALVSQVAHGFSVGSILRRGVSSYLLAKADTQANAQVVGIVQQVIDADSFVLLQVGRLDGLSGLTSGTSYYLSPTTAGAFTPTEPTTAGQASRLVLIADSSTSAWFICTQPHTIGSGGSGTWHREYFVIDATIASTNQVTLANTPASNSEFVALGLGWLNDGASNDYTLSGNTITFNAAIELVVGDPIQVRYQT